MFFIDELKDLRIYRRNFLLPLNDENKRTSCLAYIMSPNKASSIHAIQSSTNKYYNSYYIERAVLYYINPDTKEEESLVEESETITTKLYGDTNIIYNGPVSTVMDYITMDKLVNIAAQYNYTFNDSVVVNVSTARNIQLISDGESINLNTIVNFDKASFLSYDKYCDFNMRVYMVSKINPNINDWLKLAIGLYDSGLYQEWENKYKKNHSIRWPFHNNLYIICNRLNWYFINNGRLKYVNNIIKANDGLTKLTITGEEFFTVLNHIIGADEAGEIEVKDGIPLTENSAIIVGEDAKYNTVIKKLIYNDRLKTAKDQKNHYDKIKADLPDIKYTYNNLKLYNKRNLFVDLGWYYESYIKNSKFKNIKGFELFTDFTSRLLADKRFVDAGYTSTQTVVIPVGAWLEACHNPDRAWILSESVNPFSCIYYALLRNPKRITDIFGNKEVLFLGEKSYMKINFSKVDLSKIAPMFVKNIKAIINKEPVVDDEARPSDASPKAIKVDIIDKIEKSQNIIINNIAPAMAAASPMPPMKVVPKMNATSSTPTKPSTTQKKEEPKKAETAKEKEEKKKEEEKKELVDKIDKVSKNKTTVDSTIDAMDNDEEIKKLLADLASNPDNGSNISGARASRLLKLEDDFLDSEYRNMKMRDLLNSDTGSQQVKPVTLKIDSVNPEWNNLNYIAAIQSYDLDLDIRRIFASFYENTHPLAIRSLTMEDTSTSEDLINTYTCAYEDGYGNRPTIVVDIPKVIDNQYTKLRGNRKDIPGQLFLMPIIKTNEDEVQTVSCYNKIFIRRFGTTTGKSNVYADKLIKTIFKYEFTGLSYIEGDNSRVCSKYEVPMDYIDIAGVFSQIKTKHYTFIFNQDVLRAKYEIDDSKGFCVGIDTITKKPVYCILNEGSFVGAGIASMIMADIPEFEEKYNSVSESVRYCYSKASIMSTTIPLIVVCAYSVGLEPVLKKANIVYNITEKRPPKEIGIDIIRFKDAYLSYTLTYSSSLLMNGLKACNTEDYSIMEINSKPMYVDFLDMFGGRSVSDGLDNFYDCFVDPITKEVLQHYKLPTDYISILLHANSLLVDNKYIKHGDIRASRRIRKMEQIAHILYDVLARAYGQYNTGIKHGTKVPFSVKRTAVIDEFLTTNTVEDKSILNVLGEYEGVNSITPRGPSGMNNDRSYSLDKRSFDESMVNVLSAATGFAGNVGITRQATIDCNIQGPRGYIYNDPDMKTNETNSVKTLCMTESLTPYGATRDDPMRQAMGFVQTSKHYMRATQSDPLLITTGADEALAYMTSNIFSYKSKYAGTVLKVTEDYMVVEYNKKDEKGNPIREYINLRTEVEKNSSSGFYINLKLDTNLKEESKFKANEVLAYDKESFSTDVSNVGNPTYKIGTLAKMAILNTDEGYQDSAIISNALSEGMASEVTVLPKTYTIPKDANIYNLVKKGQEIQEGDVLFILQNSYDDADSNTLLKNLAADEEDITNLGRIPITSKVTGVVQDIVITRTVEKSELSPTLKKIVGDYEAEINKRRQTFKEYGIEDVNHILPDTKALPATGKLKNAADSILIEIYLSYHDKFKPGDKLIYGTAVKGVDKEIFPIGMEPTSEYRPNEKIHSLLGIGSINARMVTSVLITGGMNKALIEMGRKVKDYLGIPWDDNLL